jgi:hypothetical protein
VIVPADPTFIILISETMQEVDRRKITDGCLIISYKQRRHLTWHYWGR